MSEMIERVAKALEVVIWEYKDSSVAFQSHQLARAAIEAMRDLPEEPGPRYSAGEYSRRSQAAMVDDALSKNPEDVA